MRSLLLLALIGLAGPALVACADPPDPGEDYGLTLSSDPPRLPAAAAVHVSHVDTAPAAPMLATSSAVLPQVAPAVRLPVSRAPDSVPPLIDLRAPTPPDVSHPLQPPELNNGSPSGGLSRKPGHALA